jgi:hypothetical protein
MDAWKNSVLIGSSRITGKHALDLHEKEFAIPVTVRHSLDDLYPVSLYASASGLGLAYGSAPVAF